MNGLFDRLKPEEWRPVPGYVGTYSVSSRGRVRSSQRRGTRGKVLSPSPSGKGYLSVCLSTPSGGVVRRYVHRLLLFAFTGPCPPGMECRHLNGIRTDNHRTNLEWGTKKQNADDRRLHGTHQHGSRCPAAKLTEDDVREIRRAYCGAATQLDLAIGFDVSQSAISLIVNFKTWKAA